MLIIKHFFSALVLLILFSNSLVLAGPATKDVAGSKDHPMVSRFSGAVIAKYTHRDYDEIDVPIKAIDDQKLTNMTLSGRYTSIGYINPDNASIAAIQKSYSSALEKNGFEEIFSCNGKDECGYWFSPTFFRNKLESLYSPDAEEHSTSRYLLTKLPRPEGDVYVVLYVYSNTYKQTRTWLFVVESEPLEDDLIRIDTDADGMAKALTDEGRIALYGIHFDTGKSTIKPESETTINEISRLLKEQKDLKLIVVGHTDNQGDLKYNMNLSQERAKSVVNTLVNDHGISADRLMHWGVGFMSPTATNRSEDGRAKNRRVELVEQ
jgi:OOP family OmpA-OmpF porin